MTQRVKNPIRCDSVNTLVRYVDEDRAVIEVRVHLKPAMGLPENRADSVFQRLAQRHAVQIEVDTDQGFHDSR